MTRRLRRALSRLLAIALLPAATVATGHEYWLLPDRFAAPAGEPIAMAHRVGTGWPGETLPRDPARIVRFSLVDVAGERPIVGRRGDDPAGKVALRRPGVALAVYRSRPTPVRLEADPFESYLRDEGLERILAARAAAGESGQPANEIFSRNAKAVLTASGPDSAADAELLRRPVGLDLELVPETDPRRGDAVVVRLLYLGRPLEGALVKAIPKDGNDRRRDARTDAEGRARLVLREPGIWLLSAVHMIDAPAASGARWESLWSSLTFERPGP